MDAHQELILQAAEAEEKRLKQMEKLAEVKARMEKARLDDDGATEQGAPGMKIDEIIDEGVKEEEVDTAIVKPHSVQRKTKTQRNKEAKLLSEVRTSFSPLHLSTHTLLTMVVETNLSRKSCEQAAPCFNSPGERATKIYSQANSGT